MTKAGVIGGGAWGTALAQVCARAGLETTLWAREADVVASVNASHENTSFLPGVDLDPSIRATGDFADLAASDLVLAVAPAQHLRSALAAFAPHARDGLPILLCAKGIEQGSLKLMTEVLAETIPQAAPAVLSGPSFAGEVARGLPTAVTLACPEEDCARDLAELIATPTFRPYFATDMIGAEAGGAVKNVLAIACGIVEGRGLGRSAHAALITRGFSELTRLDAEGRAGGQAFRGGGRRLGARRAPARPQAWGRHPDLRGHRRHPGRGSRRRRRHPRPALPTPSRGIECRSSCLPASTGPTPSTCAWPPARLTWPTSATSRRAS
jgi:glycerol-3-phosphate dehydrogenase (NAD(P)+)